jgi:adenine-specific DNA-methyltransferase
LIIEGDNLEVLKLLQKSYLGKVKMIYIDPPYNTGNDFIYPDNYTESLQTYLEYTGQVDAEGKKFGTNTEADGRFHSKWLQMMYPRLYLARNLLRDDGIVCVSIDDNEIGNLRALMNEVFGEENFFAVVVVQSNKRGQTYKEIAKTHEYIVIYSREPDISLNELEKSDDALPFKDSLGPFDLWELRNRNSKFGRHNRPNLFFSIYVAVSDTMRPGIPRCHSNRARRSASKSFLGTVRGLMAAGDGAENYFAQHNSRGTAL